MTKSSAPPKKTARAKRKVAPKGKAAPKSRTRARDAESLPRDAVGAAFRVCAREGWDAVDLEAVALELDASPAELHRLFGGAEDILRLHARLVDAELEESPPSAETPARDALFELLMRRIDALQMHRAGAVRYLDSLRRDPRLALPQWGSLQTSLAATLRLAGLPHGQALGVPYQLALTALYLSVLRTWAEDEGADLGATMSALDRNLGLAAKAVSLCAFVPGCGRDDKEGSER